MLRLRGSLALVPTWAWGIRDLRSRLRLHASEATVALLHATPAVCDLRARWVWGTRCGGWEIVPSMGVVNA